MATQISKTTKRPSQIRAAKVIVEIDKKLGRETDPEVLAVANLDLSAAYNTAVSKSA